MPMRFLRPLERITASPGAALAKLFVFETGMADMLTMLLLLEPTKLAFSSFSIAVVLVLVLLLLLLDLDFVPFPIVSTGTESPNGEVSYYPVMQIGN